MSERDAFKTQIRRFADSQIHRFTDSQIRRFVDCTRLDTEIAIYTTTSSSTY